MTALTTLREDASTLLLQLRERGASQRPRIRVVRERIQEGDQRLSQVERRELAALDAQLAQPRETRALDSEPGVGAAARAGNPKLIVADAAQVAVESAREVRAIVGQAEQGFRYDAHGTTPRVVGASIEATFEVTRLAAETRMRAGAHVLGRHQAGEEQRLPQSNLRLGAPLGVDVAHRQ